MIRKRYEQLCERKKSDGSSFDDFKIDMEQINNEKSIESIQFGNSFRKLSKSSSKVDESPCKWSLLN
jgi:hypothetical protein